MKNQSLRRPLSLINEPVMEEIMPNVTQAQLDLTPDVNQAQLDLMHKYWNATNYLTAGQIYLQDNPLLKEPLLLEHINPRLLGHWGPSPGLSFIYVHLNRLIRDKDANMIYLAGPGHGGPAIVANVYLEGTYTEIYPEITQDSDGIRRLFRQFSTPGGIPSHVSVPTPGSIHEGGELGYVLAHAFGAAFDNPDLIVAAIVGDGEAESGPLATSGHSNKFWTRGGDGAALPILHLNGYKIANPTLLARMPKEELVSLLVGYGYKPYFVEGSDPAQVHPAMAATLDQIIGEITAIQRDARENGKTGRPQWPMLVLRTPKGWTGPKEIEGKKVEDFWRSHQVPFADVGKSGHLKLLEDWLKSYGPEELFDENGTFHAELKELAPKGTRRLGSNPHANGGWT